MNKALKGFSKKRFYRKLRKTEAKRIWRARFKAIVIASAGIDQIKSQLAARAESPISKVYKSLAISESILNTYEAINAAITKPPRSHT